VQGKDGQHPAPGNDDDYVGSPRDDNRYSASAAITDKLTRELWLKSEYRHDRLRSSVARKPGMRRFALGRLSRPMVSVRLDSRRCLLCVGAGLGVGISSAAFDHGAILGHDFPIPTRAVLHDASLMRVGHVILPCRTGGSATVLSATGA
jgi:hypothetical protein